MQGSLKGGAAALAAFAMGVAACGSRTGLIGPDPRDVAAQADAGSVTPAHDGPPRICAAAVPRATTSPAYIELVLDGSGSMSSEGKWVAAVHALDAVFDDLLTRADANVGIGLVVFSDSLDPTGSAGPYPTPTDVGVAAVGDDQHAALRKRIDPSLPSGSTPTYRALSGTYGYLHGFAPVAPLPALGHKVVVLISDGLPNGALVEKESCLRLAGLETVLAPPTGPVRTFAVGIGPTPRSSGYDPVFMSELAAAGETAPAGCVASSGTCHFQITPGGRSSGAVADDLVLALDRIRGLVGVACAFDLVGDVDGIDRDATTVTWTDGKGHVHPVRRDPVAGWSYDDDLHPTKLRITGEPCDALSADPRSLVDVSLACAP